jgi:hypothetical protein
MLVVGERTMRRELEVVLDLVTKIPLTDLPEFLGDLESVRNRAFVRMVAPESASASEDRLLDVAAAARRMGVSTQFLYVNSKKYSFTRRVGRRLLFSSNGLDTYLKQKKEK